MLVQKSTWTGDEVSNSSFMLAVASHNDGSRATSGNTDG